MAERSVGDYIGKKVVAHFERGFQEGTLIRTYDYGIMISVPEAEIGSAYFIPWSSVKFVELSIKKISDVIAPPQLVVP